MELADGERQRIGDVGQQALPGEEAWLIGERRSSGERKYYLSNLPGDSTLKTLAAAVKARWACEQAHQQLKEQLASTIRGAIMDRAAPARADDNDRLGFLAKPPPDSGGWGKRTFGPPSQPSLPASRQAVLDQLFLADSRRCPHCRARLTRNLPRQC